MGRWLRHRKAGWARAFLALALLGMLVRAAIPSGYMVAADEQGRFLTVTLCATHGDAEKVLDLKTGALLDQQPDEGGKQAPDAPCAFALAGALTAPHEAGAILSPFAVAMRAPINIVANLRPGLGLGLVAPPPPARGPPSLIV